MRTSPRAIVLCLEVATKKGPARRAGRVTKCSRYIRDVEATRANLRPRPRVLAFAGIFGAVLCCFAAIGAVLPILPRYVHGPLGAGDVAVGVVVGAFAFTAVIGRPIGGRLADARGRRIIVILGMLFSALGGALYFLPAGVAGLVFARLVLGIGDGWVFTAGATWIVDIAPEPARAGDRHLRAVDLGRPGRGPRARRGAVLGGRLRPRLGVRRRRSAGRRAHRPPGRPTRTSRAVRPPRRGARRCCRARSGSRVWRSRWPTSATAPWRLPGPAPRRPRPRARRGGVRPLRRRGRLSPAGPRPPARPDRPPA